MNPKEFMSCNPNIVKKGILMSKAFKSQNIIVMVADFLLFHDLWTILFQTFKDSINNKFNFSTFLPAALSEAEGLRHWNDNFPPHPPTHPPANL
jgi:hypothetical protein